MKLRHKLLLVFALTIFLSVAAVAWITSALARRSFERLSDDQTAALLAQFRSEFRQSGKDVVRRVETIAGSDAATRMAMALGRGSADYGAYLNEAKTIADNQGLDFLEFVDRDETITSSAQWPAKVGYKDNLPLHDSSEAFLKHEDLPDGGALGLFAVRQVGALPLFTIGGRRLNQEFLASLELPAGMRAMLYQNPGAGFSSQSLISASGPVPQAERLRPLVQQMQQQKSEFSTLVRWSVNPLDDEAITAIPLSGLDRQLVGMLLVGNSRRPYVQLRRHIQSAALMSAGVGMLLAIALSGWIAARVTRPVEQLAQAAQEVAAGNWNTQVPVTESDELGDLAESFNRMTGELLEQKERLVQAERVAAWRELARRLAHELKNPLFPLQLTIENLLRARSQTPEQFDEVFRESSAALLAEIANLKAIVSRFSEFSRMPQPQFQRVHLNDVVQNVVRLCQAQLHAPDRAVVECKLELAETMQPLIADPELLHRALSNLVLNAIDALPQGGTLTLRTRSDGDRTYIEVSDTGTGLTQEQSQHLFTPYYTTKAQGTGLGLAIAQSIVSDHGGSISVRSEPQKGTTFIIELPANADKLKSGVQAGCSAASQGATSATES